MKQSAHTQQCILPFLVSRLSEKIGPDGACINQLDNLLPAVVCRINNWGQKKGTASAVPSLSNFDWLAVACDRPQFAGQKMIRRPRSANSYLAVLQLLGCSRIAVLVFLNRLGIDEVSDVDQHSFRVHLLAADLFL